MLDYQAQKAIIEEQDRFGAMDNYEEPPPKKTRYIEEPQTKKQVASGGIRKSNSRELRGSKQRTKEVSQNRQSVTVFSQNSGENK